MNWLKRLFGRTTVPTVPTTTGRTTLTEDIFTGGICPICRTDGSLLSGPEGGMSVNVMCEACGTRLNLTPMLNRVEWTHGPQPDIWGGRSATMFPTPNDVEVNKSTLEGEQI